MFDTWALGKYTCIFKKTISLTSSFFLAASLLTDLLDVDCHQLSHQDFSPCLIIYIWSAVALNIISLLMTHKHVIIAYVFPWNVNPIIVVSIFLSMYHHSSLSIYLSSFYLLYLASIVCLLSIICLFHHLLSIYSQGRERVRLTRWLSNVVYLSSIYCII